MKKKIPPGKQTEELNRAKLEFVKRDEKSLENLTIELIEKVNESKARDNQPQPTPAAPDP